MTDTPTKTDLLPCPFCGKEARLAENHDVGSINCFANGCDVEPVVTWREGKKSEAIAQWNTRTPTVNLAEPRERVETLRKKYYQKNTGTIKETIDYILLDLSTQGYFDKPIAGLREKIIGLKRKTPTGNEIELGIEDNSAYTHNAAIDAVIALIDGGK